MKRISFNDSRGLNLTQMVLTGRKTMTRRNTRMYEIGDLVAIQQSYKDVLGCEHLSDEQEDEVCRLVSEGVPGCTNKMFVRADLMPHHIRITDVRCEWLQDISDEDCLREGITIGKCGNETHWMTSYYVPGVKDAYLTPNMAFEGIINKVSGRGTWKSNPIVWVYEFELVD